MSGWEALRLDELDAIPLFDGLVWRPLRRRFDIRAFGINAYESEAPGGLVVEEHDETAGGAGGHEELYVVVRGRATFTVDGETCDASAGSVVYIRDPALRRSARAEEAGTLVLAIGGERERAFEVSAWEWYFAALPHIRGERWEAAMATIEQGLAERPGHPALLYNLACVESRAGLAERALAHLNEAIDADPHYREAARDDPDLDAVRARPDFPA